MLLVLVLSVVAMPAQWPNVQWDRIASGLRRPVQATHAGDGSGRLFLVEQPGSIRIWSNGQLQAGRFLNIEDKVNSDGEMGLLGLAFPPGYESKRHFYVNYVNKNMETIVARYRVTADPQVADAGSEQVLLRIKQPYENHNGGQIAFHPKDGYLYIGMGDGGSFNDPQKNGQNLNSWFGKMLRIDTEGGLNPYGIPPDNPFRSGARPEIWSYGWRNPWRFAFDRETGDTWAADVGQNRYEEIDFEAFGSPGGRNYGWSLMEGAHCQDDANCLNRTDLVLPVYEYGRSEGCSVTGGFVYRGSRYPDLRGMYLFSDYCSGNLWGTRRGASGFETRKLGSTGLAISGFGEDERGELYLLDHRGGLLQISTPGGATSFSTRAVTSAASFQTGLTPGGIGTIFTTALPGVNGTTTAAAYPLPITLSGVSVRVNGLSAPLYAVYSEGGAGQINFLTPYATTGSQAEIVVTAGGLTSVYTVPVSAVLPALFSADGQAPSALDAAHRPASVFAGGSVLSLFATGLGEVSNRPASGDAAPADPLARTSSEVTVTIGGRSAEVLYSGLAPGFAGLYQIALRLPAGVPAGEAEVIIEVNGTRSPALRLRVQ